MARKSVVILGAGLAGLSAAYHLQKKGIACRVFEKEKEVGGLCRSKRISGFIFDYDGHLLHFKHNATFHFVSDILGNNLVKHKRNAAIFSFNRYTRFPFQANLYGLPKSVVEDCLKGFIEVCLDGSKKNKGGSFRDWINQNLGRGIARHFMIPYNTKFWTLPSEQLTADWVDGFIPVPSLEDVIKGAVVECNKTLGYNAFFWYPRRGGINELPLALARPLKHVFTGCAVTEIDIKNRKIKLASGDKENFDILLSTLPLPELPCLVKDLPGEIISSFKKLRWNSILNLNLGVEGKIGSSRHWIYFPEKEFSFFRIGFPHNFSPHLAPRGKSSLYVEVSYSSTNPIEKKISVPGIVKELIKVGIIPSEKKICVQDINYIKYGYPIYDFNYQKARGKVLDYLCQNNIISFGRYGSWRYMSMEDTILDGANTKSIF